jgi:hypothetical protein
VIHLGAVYMVSGTPPPPTNLSLVKMIKLEDITRENGKYSIFVLLRIPWSANYMCMIPKAVCIDKICSLILDIILPPLRKQIGSILPW